MNKKNKIIIIAGLLIVALAVFYFFNFLYLKGDPSAADLSRPLPARKMEARKLDISFFSDIKLNELREIPLDLAPVKQLNAGNPNLFRVKQ